MYRKYVFMAIALLGIVSKENPQKVMIRFLSKFHIAPIFEKQVFEVAQVMLRNLENAELNKAKFLNIDHKLSIEALIINLIFYCMLDSLTYGCCQKAIPAPTLEVQHHFS